MPLSVGDKGEKGVLAEDLGQPTPLGWSSGLPLERPAVSAVSLTAREAVRP